MLHETNLPMAEETRNSKVGQWGEDIAALWLSNAGYSIVGRRVRPTRHDEIDIIAKKGAFLVFVEVKTRKSEAFGRPAAAVNAAKKKALCRAASAYLRRAGYPSLYYRWDIVEVVGSPEIPDPQVNHIENAFRFPPRYRFNVPMPEENRKGTGFFARLFGKW